MRTLAIILAAVLIIAGFVVAGRVHDHRAVPAPPPLTVPLRWSYPRDEPERMPLPPGVSGFDPHGDVTAATQHGEMFPPMPGPKWPSYLVGEVTRWPS
jgi:hypothetical protein